MAKEIKVRAWHFGAQRMFSPEEMTKDQMALLPNGFFANISGVDTALSKIYTHDEMLPLEFTGLKDKNGVEIYQDDLVRVNWLAELGITELDCEAVGSVVWDENTCGFSIQLLKPYKCGVAQDMVYEEEWLPLLKQDEEHDELNFHYAIIGNIHQNPDLLK